MMYSHDYTTLQCYVLQLLQYYSINAFNNHQQQRNQPSFEHAFQNPWIEPMTFLVRVLSQNQLLFCASMVLHLQDKLHMFQQAHFFQCLRTCLNYSALLLRI